MSNLSGHKPFEVPRFLGGADFDAPIKFPMGLAPICKNSRFDMESAGCRYGFVKTMQTPNKNENITGLGMLDFIGAGDDAQIPLVFTDKGTAFKENPVGSGTLAQLNAWWAALPQNAFAQMEFAYNRGFMAFTDLKQGLARPAAYSGLNGAFNPLSSRLFGEYVARNTAYIVGEVVSPTPTNGHVYRCTTAGTTAAVQPSYTTGTGDVIVDGTAQFTEQTPVATSSGVGNICTGNRWFVVLFQFDGGETVVGSHGYISGFNADTVFSVNVSSPSQELTISPVPLGPQNCIRRIIAFGVSGDPAGANGNFAYNPEDVNTTVIESATVIEDNTTTTITVNFDDTYLGQLFGADTDVTDFYLKQMIPPCRDVSYLPSLDAMCYSCGVGYESSVLITDAGDPETLIGGESVQDIAPQNGQRVVCTRELKNGEILVWKEDSVHAINPITGNRPAGWNTTRKSNDAGACGPRAVAIGTEFAIFAHRTGIWMYDFGATSFTRISDELYKGWDLVNWDAKHLISVHIDEVHREVRIVVPYEGSATPNKQFMVSYLMGWQYPIYITMFGKLATAHQARKWSYPDDVPAYSIIDAERTLVTPVDSRINDRQILIASALADGMVRMIVPDVYHDDTNDGPVGIDWRYQTGFASDSNNKVLSLAGATVAMNGSGDIVVLPVTDDSDNELPVRAYSMNGDGTSVHFADTAGGDESEHWAYLFTNGWQPDGTDAGDSTGIVADQWGQLLECTLYADEKWPASAG